MNYRTPLIIPKVILQHAEETAVLYQIRASVATSAHARLKHLLRFDERLSAHLDGLAIADERAWPMLDAALANPSPGAIFAAATRAIEGHSMERVDSLVALAEAMPELRRGLVAAFGWVERDQLRGMVTGLLASPNAFLRFLGISACAVHRVDPGPVRDAPLQGSKSMVRARALRAAGELGRRELTPDCLSMLAAEDENSRLWAAWSAVLLGNRETALSALMETGEKPGQFRARAFRLAIQAMNSSDSREWLRKLARNPADLRYLIQGSGIAGDPSYVPWLMGHMAEKKTARIAGEAFSLITGLDLAYLDLEQKPPEDTGAGPNDDPEDPNVEMDEDDGLPWPDSERISKWWQANGGQFSPGTRYFMGGPVDHDNCIRVLKEGFQRQRILAAHYLCLLEPGTPLFEWRAPAYRQQRLLAAMV
jgi:uncharacterized protein (TIGR02270 family)